MLRVTSFSACGAEITAVEPARHAHRHHDARRLAFQNVPVFFAFARFDREQILLKDAFDESLQDRRRAAAPERKDQHGPVAAEQRRARWHR
jgi:hypothetical protein